MNVPTMIIALMMVVVFVAIVGNEIKKRKSGGGGCSCGCAKCGMADICHANKPQENSVTKCSDTVDINQQEEQPSSLFSK